jgi:Asp-tRNA(Asn)/Glu-tRNA(Gln) amidotransferase C subunit
MVIVVNTYIRRKMKISKEEIIKLADSIMLELNDQEIEQIGNSIEEMSARISELLEIEVDCEPKIMGTDNNNIYTNVYDENISTDMLTSLNGFDGTYIRTGKVIDNE